MQTSDIQKYPTKIMNKDMKSGERQRKYFPQTDIWDICMHYTGTRWNRLLRY